MIIPNGAKIKLPGRAKTFRAGDEIDDKLLSEVQKKKFEKLAKIQAEKKRAENERLAKIKAEVKKPTPPVETKNQEGDKK